MTRRARYVSVSAAQQSGEGRLATLTSEGRSTEQYYYCTQATSLRVSALQLSPYSSNMPTNITSTPASDALTGTAVSNLVTKLGE